MFYLLMQFTQTHANELNKKTKKNQWFAWRSQSCRNYGYFDDYHEVHYIVHLHIGIGIYYYKLLN